MMIETVAVDSSVLVSFFVLKEEENSNSKKFIKWIFREKIKILVPMTVLFEVFHTLRRIGWFQNGNDYKKFSNIMNCDFFLYFDLNFELFNGFKQLEFFNNLKTSDAIIAAAAFFNETVLITWDKKLLKNCYHGCTPTEFLETFA